MQAVDARNKEEEEERGRNGQFLKYQKTMKTFVYVYNTMLLVLGINKEDFTVFLNPRKPSMMVFSMRCNRVFYKFPGRSLLWTTIVVHDSNRKYFHHMYRIAIHGSLASAKKVILYSSVQTLKLTWRNLN